MAERFTRALTALVFGAGVLVTGTVLAGPASAATCTGTYGNYFAGASSAYNQGVGVSANITYHTPTLCSPDDPAKPNFGDSGWAMVASGTTGGWVQSGQDYTRGIPGVSACNRHFAQSSYTGTTTPTSHFYGWNWWPGAPDGTHCVPENQVHQAWTAWNQAQNRWNANIDQINLLNTDFGLSTYGWSKAEINFQLYGETSYLKSNMGGNLANPTNFTGILYQPTTSGTFTGICGLVGFTMASDNPSKWTAEGTNCDAMRVYTKVVQ